MEITINIRDENGETIVTKTSERKVPYIEEIEEEGFSPTFGKKLRINANKPKTNQYP